MVVVQAKGKGVFENGKVGISRDFQQNPSLPSINDFISASQCDCKLKA
jgi:hypothetical protein